MSNWLESTFVDPGMVFYRSYASGGTIYNKTFSDDFSTDNIVPSGDNIWTKVIGPGSIVNVSGGVLVTEHIGPTGGDANVYYNLPTPTYGVVQVDVKRENTSGVFWEPIWGGSGGLGHNYWIFEQYRNDVPRCTIRIVSSSGAVLWSTLAGMNLGGATWHTIKVTSTSTTTRFQVTDIGYDVTAPFGTKMNKITLGHIHWAGNVSVGQWKYNNLITSFYLPNAYALSYDKNFGSGQLWGIGTVSGTGLSGSPHILIKSLSANSVISDALMTSEPTSKTNITDWSGGSMPDGLQHARWGIWFYPDAGYLTAPTITEVDLAYTGMEAGPAVIDDSLTLNDDVSVSFPDFASIGESLSPMEEVTATLTPPTTELGRIKYYLHKRSKFITFSGIDGEINHKVTFKGFELFMKNKRACKL